MSIFVTLPDHPVYPSSDNCGITLREYFAAMAMQGFCARPETCLDTVVAWSVETADALIEALNKEQPNE